MIVLFILSAAFIAFGLYNWFFILKKMDKVTFRRTMFKTALCIFSAIVILIVLMSLNFISGV